MTRSCIVIHPPDALLSVPCLWKLPGALRRPSQLGVYRGSVPLSTTLGTSPTSSQPFDPAASSTSLLRSCWIKTTAHISILRGLQGPLSAPLQRRARELENVNWQPFCTCPLDVLRALFCITIEILGEIPCSEDWDLGKSIGWLQNKENEQTPKERGHFLWPGSRYEIYLCFK